MKKNYKLRIRLETSVVDILKREAEVENVTLSELCRNKLRSSPKLNKIELMLERLCKKSNIQINSGGLNGIQ